MGKGRDGLLDENERSKPSREGMYAIIIVPYLQVYT